jgi:hypothetical protein
MYLTKTDLPAEMVEKLRAFNVREVEPLLSMLATPTGLTAVAGVLRISLDSTKELATKLQRKYGDKNVEPAIGPFHPMGHRAPTKRK